MLIMGREYNILENFEATESIICQQLPIILYINLAHREDRKKEFLSNFVDHDHSHVVRVDAVLDKNNGAIGCLKSHIKALKMAMDLPYQNMLICEDDFEFRDITCKRDLMESLQYVPNDWDVIMFAHNTSDSRATQHKKIIQVLDSQTASCYLVRKEYIPKLLNIFEKDLNIYMKTNQWKSQYCNDQSWKILQKKDKWYAIQPSLGKQRKSYSDIQKGVVNYELFSSTYK